MQTVSIIKFHLDLVNITVVTEIIDKAFIPAKDSLNMVYLI